jgi:hypothetical protein
LATIRLRRITATIVALLALAASTAGPASATGIRVEGPRATVYQSNVKPFVGTLRDNQGNPHTTTKRTALGALVRAARAKPFPLNLGWFDNFGGGWAGFYLQSVNGVTPPTSAFWATKVDRVLTTVGAGAATVTSSDNVLVYYTTFDPATFETLPTLGIGASTYHPVVGKPLRITVNQADDLGHVTPTPRAWVWVNGVGVQTDENGRATVRLGKPRLFGIRATKQGTIRSRTLWVRATSS